MFTLVSLLRLSSLFGNAGQYTRTVIGLDDNAFIAFHDDAANTLVGVHCHDRLCESFTSRVLDADGVETGRFLDMRIGGGFPVISYAVDHGVRLLTCQNTNCSDANIQQISKTPDKTSYTALYVDGKKGPAVAFNTFNKKTNHSSLALFSENQLQVVDQSSVGVVGKYPSVVGLPDTRLCIAYQRKGVLAFALCRRRQCSITVVDASGTDVGRYNSIALNAAAQPINSYFNEQTHTLHTVTMIDADQFVRQQITTVGSSKACANYPFCPYGEFNRLTITSNQNTHASLPLISFYNETGVDSGCLMLGICFDNVCSRSSFQAIACGSDGFGRDSCVVATKDDYVYSSFLNYNNNTNMMAMLAILKLNFKS